MGLALFPGLGLASRHESVLYIYYTRDICLWPILPCVTVLKQLLAAHTHHPPLQQLYCHSVVWFRRNPNSYSPIIRHRHQQVLVRGAPGHAIHSRPMARERRRELGLRPVPDVNFAGCRSHCDKRPVPSPERWPKPELFVVG